MFHWYLLVGNFVIFFGLIWFSRLLLIHVLFLTWSACFGSIVFICYVVSAGSSSQLVLILSLIFGWTLSVQDVSLISFSRKFCNFFWIDLVFEITFDTCFSFDLICLFWVNSVYLLCCYLCIRKLIPSCFVYCRNWLNVNDISIHVFLFVLFCNIWYVLI